MQTAKVFEVTKVLVNKHKTFIIYHILLRIGILIKSDQPATLAEMLHNFARMSTATKGYIYISTIGLNIKRLNTLLQHNRVMVITHYLPFLNHPLPLRPG